LHVPWYTEHESETVDERSNWPQLLGDDISVVGITPRRLFEGMKDEEIRLHYYDGAHLNLNGNRFFTRAIAPALLKLHDEVSTASR